MNDSPSGRLSGTFAQPGRRALAGALLTALAGCSTTSIQPPESLTYDTRIKPSTSAPAESVGVDRYFAFNRALADAQAHLLHSGKQAVLLQEGMYLVTSKCAEYFGSLGTAEQHLRFARKETALTGGVVAAMLGLSGATSKTLANTASVFGFTTASMDSYIDSYIFSPDVKVLQNLVMGAMKTTQDQGNELVTQASQGKGSLSYTQVQDFLVQMEAHCQPHGVRDLVNKAVGGVKTTPTSSTPGTATTTATITVTATVTTPPKTTTTAVTTTPATPTTTPSTTTTPTPTLVTGTLSTPGSLRPPPLSTPRLAVEVVPKLAPRF